MTLSTFKNSLGISKRAIMESRLWTMFLNVFPKECAKSKNFAQYELEEALNNHKL